MMRRLVARRDHQAAIAGVLAAGLAFAAATLVRRGLTANGCAWAVVQVALAGIAAYDIATRRIRNLVTVPGSLLAILLPLGHWIVKESMIAAWPTPKWIGI